MDHLIFKEALLNELYNLKFNASRRELYNLQDTVLLRPNDRNGCIYGIMTGDCWNRRAAELINLCCSIKIISREEDQDFATKLDQHRSIEDNVERLNVFSDGRRYYFSAIETMLFHAPEDEIKRAVCFLKENNAELGDFDLSGWNSNRSSDEYNTDTKEDMNAIILSILSPVTEHQ